MDPIIIGVIVSSVGLIWGSIEVRMRNLDNKLRDVPTRREVSDEIEVRQESLRVLQQEIKEDIREMRRSLEKLTEDK